MNDVPNRPDPFPSSRPGRWAVAALLVTLGLHTWATLRLFPTWPSIGDDTPVVMVDHAIHLYHGAIGSAFVRADGRSWGFDPFFMAGYPETPVWDSSSNLAIAAEWLAGGGYQPRAYKLGLLVLALACWLMLPLGARAAGLGWDEAAAAGVLAATVFWACYPAAFWRSGLFAFITVSAALPLMLGLALRLGSQPGWGRGALLAAAGAAWLFAHVTAPLMLTGGAVGFAATHLRPPARRGLALAASAAVLAVAVNLPWLVPLWTFRGIRSPTFFFMAPGSLWSVWNFCTTNPLDGRVPMALLLAGAGGIAFWAVEREASGRPRAATFGATIVALVLLTVCGGLWSVTRALEPFRFLVTLDLFLCVPAGSLAVRGLRRFARATGGGRKGAAAAATLGGVVVAVAALASPATFVIGFAQATKNRPLTVGLRSADRALVAWLRTQTDTSARVLLEDQLRLLELTDIESTHWTPLLPVLLADSPRAFIGGIYHTAFIAHNKAAGFGDYTLGGRPMDEWTDAALAEQCNRYNIGWAVCWSPLSRLRFDRFDRARRVGFLPRPASPGRQAVRDDSQWQRMADLAGPELATRYLMEGVNRYALYQIDRPRSYTLEGRGRVVALGYDRVELADLEPDPVTKHVTLSLHWLDTWRTEPPLPLQPAPQPGDPVPFVRFQLTGPTPRVILTNGR